MDSEYTLVQKIKIRLRQFHMQGNRMIFDNAEENPILEQLIADAYESVKKVRNYPSNFSDEKIEKDMEQYESIIINLVIYDYNKEGMDFENAHTESGVSRQFSSRARVMGDVLPFVHIF